MQYLKLEKTTGRDIFSKKLNAALILVSVCWLYPGGAVGDPQEASAKTETVEASEPEETQSGETARTARAPAKPQKKEQKNSSGSALTVLTRDEIREIARQEAELLTQEYLVSRQIEEEMDEYRSLRLYGFYDVSFLKYFFSDHSAYNSMFSNETTFLMSSVNLYLDSELNDVLRSLVELKFSFLPLGYERGFETEVNGLKIEGFEYDRVDTLTRDYYTAYEYRLGGVAIERAHLTYSPRQWLNIRAGRYITPYGIWNVDHSPTVYTTSSVPYMQLQKMMPLAQTGLQVFGKFFPLSGLQLEYALTLSNGRGPIESVIDLDDNKGVGLRLKLNYRNGDFLLALGSYAYYGRYTDVKKIARLDTVEGKTTVNAKVVEQYDEYNISGDLMVQAFGLSLIVEGVYSYAIRDAATPLDYIDQVALVGRLGGDYAYPSWTGWAGYILLAYDLPLRPWLGAITVTPYFELEQSQPQDFAKHFNIKVISGGLNVRPFPSVVLKAEYGAARAAAEINGELMTYLNLQLAVSY